MSVPHVIRAIAPPASPAPVPRLVLCASCGQPLAAGRPGVLWHRETGTLPCRPVLDASDGGWSEPDDWADGPCAAVRPESGPSRPERGAVRPCHSCAVRTVWTGYAWEHCSSGRSGTLSCDRRVRS
jgi:hypothetical protein